MKILMLVLCFFVLHSNAQETVQLLNPSFEGQIKMHKLPPNWDNCQFAIRSTPETGPQKHLGVTKEPINGNRYLFLVTRPDGTWEAAGQALSSSLKANTSYQFSLYLSREKYLMPNNSNNLKKDNTPIPLRIWGGTSECEKKELLGQTRPIESTDWMEYYFRFTPQNNINYITFEVICDSNISESYLGNITLDQCSSIKPLPSISTDSVWTDSIVLQLSTPYRRYPDLIELINPSFEELSRKDYPSGWENCFFLTKTINKKLPELSTFYKSTVQPFYGERWLTLEVDEDGKTEKLAQEIDYLQKGKTYQISIALARNGNYHNLDVDFMEFVSYSIPSKLKIWGGKASCEKRQLFAESPVVTHFDWKTYTFQFTPTEDLNYILFEADWNEDYGSIYNGHILLDAISDIIRLDD